MMRWRRKRTQADFDAEIASHLQLEADQLRAEGAPEEEARVAARRAFGNVTAVEERFYEAARVLWADRLGQDVRYAARTLRRSPAVTAAAVLSLALGIGANTAIFSVVNALMLRPYAFPELDRLITISELHPQQGKQATVRPSDPGHPMAPADFLDVRRESRSFEGLAALRARDFTLVGEGEPERLAGRLVSPELFGLLRADAALGRTLRPEEADAGRDAVAVVSHGLWQRRLGGAPDVVGRPLVLNGRPHTVVGVMPPEFNYPPGGVEVWAPLSLSDEDKTARAPLSLSVIGRLAPGVTLDQARDDLGSMAARLQQTHPRTNTGRTFKAVRLREQQAGITAPFAALFQGAALFVLLIACANVGGLLLARGLGRQREMALRAALGASRWRIARQLLTESLMLSLLGLLLALGVAAAGVEAIRGSVPVDITKWVAGWRDIRLDESVLGFAVAVALATALVTGLSPALGAARLALTDVLREGGRGATAGRHRWRSMIVVSQMALALLLLVGSGLMVRGFGRMMERYEGFDPAGVLSFRMRLPESRYAPGRPMGDFYARLLDGLAAVPGVESAATVGHLPGDMGPVPAGAVSIRGRTTPGDLDLPVADYQSVSADYFRTLNVRRVAGRALGVQDGPEAPPVAVVSQSMARRLWPGGTALGQQVKQGRPDDPGPWREVVGVVEDVTQYWFDREPRSTLYLPHQQVPRAASFVLVRVAGEAAALAPALRAAVAALDPGLPLDEMRTLRQVVDDAMAILRLSANLLLLLGGVALALSALGVYGIMAQDVAQRTQEIGVRLALGATAGEVRRLVLGRALGLAALALLIGVPAALALGRLMASALFGVVRVDAASLAAFSGGLLATALLAGLVPALRAAALDPVAVLRSE
jgi:putative ABC transport system permease protein